MTAVQPDIDFISGQFWARNPHAELTWLRDNDPVHWDGRAWGITRHADIKAVSRQTDLFCSGQGMRPDMNPVDQMIDMDDPKHKQRRRLVYEGFTPRRVAAQEGSIRALADAIIDRVCERGECDLVRDIAAWLPIEVIGASLGFAAADYGTLLEWSDALVSGLSGSQSPETLAQLATAFDGYFQYITGVISDRRALPLDDLISVLIHAEIDGERLDDMALVFESLLILIGGDETSRHVMTGGIFQLLRDRRHWELLRRDRSLVTPATEEMLRWVSPIKTMARTLTRDTVFQGRAMSEGQKVVLLYPSANRDAAVFEDPFTFDLQRKPNDHVAFGFGNHFCLGNALARLEVRVMVDRLLERLPDLTLVSEDEPAYRPANLASGYESMPVRFTPVAPLNGSESSALAQHGQHP